MRYASTAAASASGGTQIGSPYWQITRANGRGSIVPYGELLEEIFALTRESAEALDCVAELQHARQTLEQGTSAHRQIAIFDKAVAAGADKQEALHQVVDYLIEASVP